MSWRVRFDIEYDGSEFAGWQIQPEVPTIQGVLEEALARLYACRLRVTAAGRTDAGVHATGQVAHTTIPNRRYSPARLTHALNALTPDSVLIRDVTEVPAGFCARRSAVGRYYRYRLTAGRRAYERQYLWSTGRSLSVSALRECAAALPGTHRFTSFCVTSSAGRGTECRVTEACWRRSGSELQFHIRANRFVRGMVRSLVGTMVEVASGRMQVETFERLLERPSRREVGPPAPACGLCLMAVEYPANATG